MLVSPSFKKFLVICKISYCKDLSYSTQKACGFSVITDIIIWNSVHLSLIISSDKLSWLMNYQDHANKNSIIISEAISAISNTGSYTFWTNLTWWGDRNNPAKLHTLFNVRKCKNIFEQNSWLSWHIKKTRNFKGTPVYDFNVQYSF